MSVLTFKFGGTSMGSAEIIKGASQIIIDSASQGHQVLTVVSAMTGVTNQLLDSAYAAARGDTAVYLQATAALRDRHHEAARALVHNAQAQEALLAEIHRLIDGFQDLCRSVAILGELTNRGLDAIVSIGERLSARLMAAHLQDRGYAAVPMDATRLIVTGNTFQNAVPQMDKTAARVRQQILPLLKSGVLPIVTGFIGATEEGVTTTLGRGGSDYSAGILAACVEADELWVWTDVDGVMTTDPRLVPAASVIPVLSYREVGELAFFGAKVLHPKTILPVMDRGMPILVRNTFNPTHPGTRIQPEAEITDYVIKAITIIQDVHLITVAGRGMVGVPGIAGRTFSAVARENVNLLVISQSSSEQSMCFIVPDRDSARAVEAIKSELAREIERQDVDDVWAQENIEIITIVGAGLRETPGIAARVFGVLAEEQINVIVITQGSSDTSLSIAVDSADAKRAVQALHRLVVGNGNGH
ncbi:MAG: aspartate kinase [Anaerolineae bacterium]|nr:aspartate kinase [Anaerolineae bacterium]